MVFLFFLALLSTIASFGRAQDVTQSTTKPDICQLDPSKKSLLAENWINVDNAVTAPSVGIDGSKPSKTKQLNVCNESDKLLMVSEMMYSLCQYPYICQLDDGSMFQGEKGKDCVTRLDRTKYPWGMGANLIPLSLYTSVSTSGVPLGTKLLIAELKDMPLLHSKKMTHNGCVKVDDICDYCMDKCQDLDLHVGYYSNFNGTIWPDDVTVTVGADCEILKYD